MVLLFFMDLIYNKMLLLRLFFIIPAFTFIETTAIGNQYEIPEKYDTLRILLVDNKNTFYRIGNEDYKAILIGNIEFKNLLKKFVIEEKYTLSVGLSDASDPKLVRFFMEDLTSLKIKKYIEKPFDNSELKLLDFPIRDTTTQLSDSIPPNKNKVFILVFNRKKLVWYLNEEYPKINIEDYTPNSIKNLVSTYRNLEFGLKFAENANVEMTKSILNNLNEAGQVDYEFEELLEEEKNIAMQLLNQSK